MKGEQKGIFKAMRIRKISVRSGAFFFVTGILVLGFIEAWGADWLFYGRNDKYFCSYDLESIHRLSQNIVRVSDKQTYTTAGVDSMVGQLGQKYENLSHTITFYGK